MPSLLLLFCVKRCAGAGHLRDDIFYYTRELEKFPDIDDEQGAYIMDMGIKALRYLMLFLNMLGVLIFLLSNWQCINEHDSCYHLLDSNSYVVLCCV